MEAGDPGTLAQTQEHVMRLLDMLEMPHQAMSEDEMSFARQYRTRHEAAGRPTPDAAAFEARLATVHAILSSMRQDPSPETISLDAIDHVLGTRSSISLDGRDQEMIGGFILENLLVMLSDPKELHVLARGRTDPMSLDVMLKTMTPLAMMRLASDPDVLPSDVSHFDVLSAIYEIVPLAHCELEDDYSEYVADLAMRALIPSIGTDDPDLAIDALARAASERAEALGLDGDATNVAMRDCVEQCSIGVHYGYNAFVSLPVIEGFLADPDDENMLEEIVLQAVTCHRLSYLLDDETPLVEAVAAISGGAMDRIDPYIATNSLNKDALCAIVRDETMRFLTPDLDAPENDAGHDGAGCACCAAGPEAYFAEQDRMIEEHGFSYSMIQPGPNSPGFVYTIGLAEKGLPEFIFVGGCDRNAVDYISSLVDHVRNGGTIEPGMIPPGTPMNGFTVPQWVIEADDKLRTHAYGVTSRLERIDNDELPHLMQVVMPDHQGLFPWDDGYQWRDQQVSRTPPGRTIH